MQRPIRERGALVGAVIAGLLSSACCIGPLLLGTVGFGSLGLGAALTPLRPWFLGLTAVFLGTGFFIAYRPPAAACAPGDLCAKPGSRRNQRLGLWLVTLLTAAFATYPSWGARLTAARASAAFAESADSLVVLDIRGMTCAACGEEIDRELSEVPGVVHAKTSFEQERAEIRVMSPAPRIEVLIAAVGKAGYRAAPTVRRPRP